MPPGILLTRRKSLQTPILGIANVLQTIPSLALFGLLIPTAYIGGIGAKTAAQVDLIAGNSTDGLISALDLFQLADDKKYFPPYRAVFIARVQKLKTLAETFEKLRDAISTGEMRRLSFEADGDKLAPKEAANDWLKKKNF